jgi:tetratricopeptide (TPR) repeat protein
MELGRLDEALASLDTALTLRPDYVEALNSRGVVLKELRRLDEALASFERAVALEPDHADAHLNEALLRLLMGDFERGWPQNEWRWQDAAFGVPKPHVRLPRRDFTQPQWRGSEALYGKTILLHSEQGFGDTIQFCRYARMVATRGARVILEVEEPLRQLMSGVSGVWYCAAKGETLPDFDLHCPLLSLPLAFGTRLETIPTATPYLRAGADERDWEARLPPGDRPRIGLAWSGNPHHRNDARRSIPLDALAPLFDFDATFVSLQRDVREGDAAALEESRILDLGGELADFADTAALMSRLDLVITVDTSVAHLAGALGRRSWILLPFVPDWRWLIDRDDSPWYPTARLFRQADTREWPSVVARVREALQDWLEHDWPKRD